MKFLDIPLREKETYNPNIFKQKRSQLEDVDGVMKKHEESISGLLKKLDIEELFLWKKHLLRHCQLNYLSYRKLLWYLKSRQFLNSGHTWSGTTDQKQNTQTGGNYANNVYPDDLICENPMIECSIIQAAH